jgi:hypothetical protein
MFFGGEKSFFSSKTIPPEGVFAAKRREVLKKFAENHNIL